MKLWREHSLTIVTGTAGAALVGWGWTFEQGKAFDTLLSLGTGALTVALFYFAANFFREVAKPEDDPNETLRKPSEPT